ncbi:hypothetical protein [Micromonospora sp. NBRC 107095]|uniref:hypothetical protein n=1 Tax=Micromonospora sp. NBRC 107095 TaxID=3032209 RepID=UPI0024A53881|nr:hypothetical protein [Micromonospora sp. NBRC 107095]GLZ62874.1 hypothetical protein Misp05_64500 [Micromonospora sp. NBRC 107095]
MKVTVTSSGLNELAVTLESAADDAVPEGRKVVSKGALNIKNDWRRRWSGSPHAPALPYAIGYDIRTAGTLVSAEIGPDKAKRQGALGNLYEFGSVNNAPRPGGAPALAAESPRFVAALEKLAVDLLED